MADLIDIPTTNEPIEQMNFNVLIPRPFVLSEQPKDQLDKIKDEVMDKVRTWESRMSNFFKGYLIAADSWRIRPEQERKRGSKTLFNSKSGETHRAAETLGTIWQRMLTASDPWFDVNKMGLNPDGSEVTEEQLFSTQCVLLEQQKAMQFKRKLLRSLRGTALFGISFVENPFVSLPYGQSQKYMEFTDWVPRPLIRSGFDTTVYDVNDSDFIFFIDFLSKWMLRNHASQDTDFWDRAKVESHIKEFSKGMMTGNTDAYSRVMQSRSRAGYSDTDMELYETVSYHGRLDTENPVIQALSESIGLKEDPKYVDWSTSILDGMDLAKLHMTQYGDWRTRARVLTYKDFEDEPLPYGVGQLGRKLQREMDITESLANDKATFDVLNMWKIGKYSGYDQKQFIAEPLKAIELEDVSQMMPLVGDPNVLNQVLSLISIRREDFRNIVGAQTNLQGQVTKASATETSIAQNESMRSAGVHAEILAEAVRGYLDIAHVNNLNYLDEPIWAGMTGTSKPVLVDKNKLPINVGFIVKMITDKDFRPAEINNMLQALQIFTSARNFLPPSMNPLPSLLKQLWRKFGLNPSDLSQPMTAADMLAMNANRLANGQGLPNELQGEMMSEGGGGVAQVDDSPIPTSSIQYPEESA